jgi:hypothetical protein
MLNKEIHRTGKPYVHQDVDFLIQRGTKLDIYEMGLLWVHLENCPECEEKIGDHLDELLPDGTDNSGRTL